MNKVTERTPEYQRKAEEYAKSLKPYLGNVPELSEKATDQQTFEGLVQLHQRALTKFYEAHGQQKVPSQNIWVRRDSLGVVATDMSKPDGDQVKILDNGTIVAGKGEILSLLVAMKPLDQSLPDFMKTLADEQTNKKK